MLVIGNDEHECGGHMISVQEGRTNYSNCNLSIIYLLSIISISYLLSIIYWHNIVFKRTPEHWFNRRTTQNIYISKGKGTLVPLLISKFDGDRQVHLAVDAVVMTKSGWGFTL